MVTRRADSPRFLLGALLLAGCGTRGVRVSDETPAQESAFSFDVRVDTETTLQTGSASEALPSARLAFTGSLTRSEARTFSDGSVGNLVRLGPMEVALDDAAPTPSELAGRSFEIRAFPDGEILDLTLVDHLAGPGRHGDLLLPLWASLSPHVPRLAVGDVTVRRVNLPFRLSATTWIHPVHLVEWTYQGVEDHAGGRCHHLTWRGRVEGSGEAGAEQATTTLALHGATRGDLWLSVGPALLVEEVFHWDTTLTAAPRDPTLPPPGSLVVRRPTTTPPDPASARRVVQRQVLDGTVRAHPGPALQGGPR